jgi:predicted NUDIX family NTP pyrophosphohydrolase
MPKKSAGLLLYRENSSGSVEVLLVHPGGPFWRNKDDGAWTIPKGEFDDGEDPLAAAKREFEEETGAQPPPSNPGAPGNSQYIPLEPIKQSNGKTVHAWAVQDDFDPANIKSNLFQIEWPPKSGRTQEFPEIDRAQWFTPEVAKQKIIPAQAALIDELLTVVNIASN